MPFPMEDEAPPPPPLEKPGSIIVWMLVGVPLGLLITALVGYLWVLPDLGRGGSSKQTESCLSNLAQLARATQMYAADHDDRVPEDLWNDKLMPYLKNEPDADILFECPVQRRIDPTTSGYAMSNLVAGKKLHSQGPLEQTILIFDSLNVQPSAVAPPDAMPSPGRHEHGRTNNEVYADGHTRIVPAH